jgi:pseudaminic acid cytidylyltransferase
MNEKSQIAIIPARGGSKRLPRKNVLPFMGRPIISWTISAALEYGLFHRVVVSTEDKAIAATAIEAGAEVDARDPALATDTARVVDVCMDILDREEAAGRSYDVLCCLYATAPLRNATDIAATVDLLQPGYCDFSMAVTPYSLPPFRALRQSEDSLLTPVWPDLVNARADDIGEWVVGNGSTYAATVPSFRKTREFVGPNMRGHFMPRSRSVDIDEMEDLEIARFHAQRLGFGEDSL